MFLFWTYKISQKYICIFGNVINFAAINFLFILFRNHKLILPDLCACWCDWNRMYLCKNILHSMSVEISIIIRVEIIVSRYRSQALKLTSLYKSHIPVIWIMIYSFIVYTKHEHYARPTTSINVTPELTLVRSLCSLMTAKF